MKTKPKTQLETFLQAWELRQWPTMYLMCQTTWKSNNSIQKLIDIYKPHIIKDVLISDKTDFTSRPICDILFEANVNGVRKMGKARLIFETAPYKVGNPKAIFNRKGNWGVNPISVLSVFSPNLSEKTLKSES